MKKTLIGAATVALGLTGALAFTAPASAETPVTSTCLTGWYVNTDEQDRLPVQVDGGLQFEDSDLVHHAASLDVADLTPGTFVAAPAPDQDSFFSVEVMGTDGGYGTLRWNTTTSKWNLITGGQFYENVNAEELVDMPPTKRSHKVVSFGVGYTANPPGTVTTVVSSVTFAGTTYDLSCAAEESPSPSPTSPSPTPTSPSPTPSQPQSESPSATPSATPSQSQEPITPAAPKIGKVTCDQFELLTDDRAGLNWNVADTKVNGDTVTIKVVVTAADGVIKDGVQTEWDLSFKIPANCTATPAPTEVPTSPAAGGQLPVTGPGGGTNVPLISGLAGGALLAFGIALFAWAKRRRDNDAVEFTA